MTNPIRMTPMEVDELASQLLGALLVAVGLVWWTFLAP